MHKFMRSIGFSKFADRRDFKKIIKEIVLTADERAYTINDDEVMLGEFCKEFAKRIGIAACGEFDEEDKFHCEYYFPYLRGRGITTMEDVTIERHSYRESYAGVCDDVKVGITLIFYLQNMIPYVKEKTSGLLPQKGTSLTLSALSTEATIMMPILKNEHQKQNVRRVSANRSNLIQAARKGDEDAIETLTLEDMDMYTAISKKIQKEDIFSIVDTYFMPYGVECDHYSVLGEIQDFEKVRNEMTGEEIYILSITSNELTFDVAINAMDLVGEPMVGRRFKGIIWLQGLINYPA